MSEVSAPRIVYISSACAIIDQAYAPPIRLVLAWSIALSELPRHNILSRREGRKRDSAGTGARHKANRLRKTRRARLQARLASKPLARELNPDAVAFVS